MNEALIKDSTIVQGKFTEELSPDMGTGLVLRLKTDCSVVWLKDKMHCFRVWILLTPLWSIISVGDLVQSYKIVLNHRHLLWIGWSKLIGLTSLLQFRKVLFLCYDEIDGSIYFFIRKRHYPAKKQGGIVLKQRSHRGSALRAKRSFVAWELVLSSHVSGAEAGRGPWIHDDAACSISFPTQNKEMF
jgi:hypothetical protein